MNVSELRRRWFRLFARGHGACILLASNYGQERPPAWWFNLQAEPDCEVRVAGKRRPMRARVLEGTERDTMLERMARYNKQWRGYQNNVHRELPVVRLEPR